MQQNSAMLVKKIFFLPKSSFSENYFAIPQPSIKKNFFSHSFLEISDFQKKISHTLNSNSDDDFVKADGNALNDSSAVLRGILQFISTLSPEFRFLISRRSQLIS